MSSGVAPHAAVERATTWSAEPEAVGTVAVVGLGKIGLPLAARYAEAGWRVIGVDVLQGVVDSVNDGRSHIDGEPGVDELVRAARAEGRLEATTSHADAAAMSDVIVMIVPIMLDGTGRPDYAWMDSASAKVAAGMRPGTLVVYETTLPVGDTRDRYGPLMAEESGLSLGDGPDGFYLAFSPERVFSGRILQDLRTYPKLVGGVDADSTAQAMAFYRSVLDAEVWDLGDSETAEFAKLAETTYRDVNIALANEFAGYADQVGVDITAVIRGANSQPYSHIHQPGIGVGGHCIPVYPRFLLHRAPDMELVATSRRTNDDQVARAVSEIEQVVGDLRGTPVLVLGLTYREGVPELAYSRGPVLVEQLLERGALVTAFDPLLEPEAVARLGAEPYAWGQPSDARVVVTQTADGRWSDLRQEWFPRLELVYDGRNSLPPEGLAATVAYRGVGRNLSEPQGSPATRDGA